MPGTGHAFQTGGGWPVSHWTLEELKTGSGGEILRPAATERPIVGIAIDSRTMRAGQAFLCLRGDRTDGHQYIAAAVQAGASAIIVERGAGVDTALCGDRGIIAVEDGLTALQNLARFHRGRLTGTTILGVTGSNGKTSTKEMLFGMAGALVGPEKVFATQGNLNNHIGLPLSVLAIDESCEIAILELGMNHPGEIETLTRIARPHHALITSVSGAHQAYFAAVEDIARAKLEILEGLEKNGTLVFHLYSPGGDLALDLVRKRIASARDNVCRVVFFGGWPDDRGGSIKPWPFVYESLDGLLWDDRLSMMERVQIGSAGIAFVWQGGQVSCANYFSFEMAENLLGALTLLEATGRFFPDQLRSAACAARPLTPGRFQLIPGGSGAVALLVDDSYNANPDSFMAALRALRELRPAGTLGVLAGEMAELGAEALKGHRAVGAFAAAQGYALFAVSGGELAGEMLTAFQKGNRSGRGWHCADVTTMVSRLGEILNGQKLDGLLVKGSRSARMDQICQALRAGGFV